MRPPSNPRLASILLIALFVFVAGCAPPALFVNESGGLVSTRSSDANIPQGMRRTKNGWEDASLWHLSINIRHRSIDSWIDDQRQREPNWLRRIFEEIRTTPPLMIAVIQITAIAAIVHVSRSETLRPPS